MRSSHSQKEKMGIFKRLHGFHIPQGNGIILPKETNSEVTMESHLLHHDALAMHQCANDGGTGRRRHSNRLAENGSTIDLGSKPSANQAFYVKQSARSASIS